jgi:transmembrane secretion effector
MRRWPETFMVDSWLEHLRQHQRVTKADRTLQNAVSRFHTGGPPRITHFIAAEAVQQNAASPSAEVAPPV